MSIIDKECINIAKVRVQTSKHLWLLDQINTKSGRDSKVGYNSNYTSSGLKFESNASNQLFLF